MSDGKFEHDTGHLHRLVLFSDAVFAIVNNTNPSAIIQ